MSDDDRFSDSPVSRRQFFKLSAATGAALSLPGNATASAESESFTPEYEYVLNHTPVDHRVPTLVTFSDSLGVEAFEALGLGEAVQTTTTPQPAAYAQLTTVEAQQVAELPAADEFQFSPGSNPFWRIGYYPAGVYPEPRRSVDFIGFEQMKDGLAELESRYPDTIRVKNIGESPGHHNNLTDRADPKGMYVVEVTNDVRDEESFREKEKVFFSCSLHGLEAAGREAGARIIENVARGSEPDIEGSDEKIEPLLDDVVLIIGFTNPDGWAVRNPQYDSGWQLGGPGTGGVPRAPAAPLYERGNAEVFDTNRQYPIVGTINPGHYPAYPDPDSDGPDSVPAYVDEKVPDAKAFVEHFRTYENLNYGADLHGMPFSNQFVLGLISQDQFNTRQMHELYEMCRNIDETLGQALSEWETVGDLKEAVGIPSFGVVPETAFDYSTIYDTLGYTVSGAFLDWMAHPEPVGLDMTTLDFEMSFTHMVGGNVYNPELYEMEVTGYRTTVRTITAFAVRNSDTPNTTAEFEAVTETGGESVAYVTTGPVASDADALQRTDADLDFEGDGGGSTSDSTGGGTTTYDETELTEVVDAEGLTSLSHTVTESDIRSLNVHLHAQQAVMDLELVDPDGEVVRSFEGVTEDRVGGKCCGFPEWTVSDPAAGEWTLRVANRLPDAQAFELRFGTLASTATNPDPVDVLGYDQLEYAVSPFRFFEDYDDSIPAEDPGALEPVTVAEVADGALADYDHAVVVHDYGANADADYIGDESVPGYAPADHPSHGFDEDGYVDALDSFVNGGGNLVLTDTGVNLLAELDNELVAGDAFTREDVSITIYDVAAFSSKNLQHPLFGDDDVRPIQNQLWKVAPLGYQVSGEAPMHLLNESAFLSAAAGEGSVAGRTDGNVAAGSITAGDGSGRGVHVVSSLLPPATQRNLHPFGLQDYSVSFLGYILFTSALGFEQVRKTAGDEEQRFGRGDDWSFDGGSGGGGGGLSASGSRETDGSTATGGSSYRVTVSLDSLSAESGTVEVRDSFPSSWTFLERFSDGEEIDAENGVVSFGDVAVEDFDGTSFTYFVEAPEGVGSTNQYTFGPAEVVDGEESVEFAGTQDVLLVGLST